MKYRSILELKNKIIELKKYDNVIVFTNGCFDILHKGHITYLSEARELGDYLIVGLNSDRSVTQIKGPERPINNQCFRSEKLLELNSVDDLIIFDEDTPQNLINELQPNILVKGGDYKKNEIVGAREVEKKGGEVVILPLVPGYSTTEIIKEKGLTGPEITD
jgi:rfaE bifunctional protein nucleotidyltransferase chain/domain